MNIPHFLDAALTALVGFWCLSLTLFLVALGIAYARSMLETRVALRQKTEPDDLLDPAAH